MAGISPGAYLLTTALDAFALDEGHFAVQFSLGHRVPLWKKRSVKSAIGKFGFIGRKAHRRFYRRNASAVKMSPRARSDAPLFCIGRAHAGR
jgi:hypothetical protein